MNNMARKVRTVEACYKGREGTFEIAPYIRLYLFIRLWLFLVPFLAQYYMLHTY